MHLPRPGLAGLRTGEDGLHTQQQAQGDLLGDAVGRRAWRPPPGRRGASGLSPGQTGQHTPVTPVGPLLSFFDVTVLYQISS